VLRDVNVSGGFTLVEMLVALAVLSILLVFAAPALSTYSENSKLRAMAGSFMASAQTARVEAIRTNSTVQLVLTTDDPMAANVSTANLNASAGGWIVRTVSAATPPVYGFVAGKSLREGSGSSSGTSSVQLSAVSNGVATSAIGFNGAGSTSLDSRMDVNFSSSKGACAADSGPIRCLRVVITVSGQIRMCDPAATGNDVRAC